jgi:hypothetical protein
MACSLPATACLAALLRVAAVGGSIAIFVAELLASTGSIPAMGGAGGYNAASPGWHGGGASGGRIALSYLQQPFGNAAVSAWSLALLAGDGASFADGGSCGSLGTFFVDCGAANRVAVIDNGARPNAAVSREAVLPVRPAGLALTEVRITNNSSLRATPADAQSAEASPVQLSMASLTGDASGWLTLGRGVRLSASPGATHVLKLSGVSISVLQGAEAALPPSLLLTSASVPVTRLPSGAVDLTVGSGGSLALGALGHTASADPGQFTFPALSVAVGRSVDVGANVTSLCTTLSAGNSSRLQLGNQSEMACDKRGASSRQWGCGPAIDGGWTSHPERHG